MQRDGIVKSVGALIRGHPAPPCLIAANPAKRGGATHFGRIRIWGIMVTTSRYLEAPRRLRAFVRAHETSLVVLAALVGILAGLVVAAMSAAVDLLHVVLFNLEWGDRLSSQVRIDPLRGVLVPSLGGLL